MFSERSISAVPIIDEEGVVVNLYETVDVIVGFFQIHNCARFLITWYKTLVRLGAYQSLDLTVSEALNQRSPDFPGVVVCTASDSLGTLLQLIKKRRVHRLVVVEGEVGDLHPSTLFIKLTLNSYCRRRKEKVARKVGCWVSLHSVMFSATLLGTVTSVKA